MGRWYITQQHVTGTRKIIDDRATVRSIAEPNDHRHLTRLRSDSDDLVVAQVVIAVEQARGPVLRFKVRLELVEVDRVVLVRDRLDELVRDLSAKKQTRCAGQLLDSEVQGE